MGLAQNPNVTAVAERVFRGTAEGSAVILNQHDGILHPLYGERYNQDAQNRDLHYKHVMSSRPLSINALFYIAPFTLAYGATLVARGT